MESSFAANAVLRRLFVVSSSLCGGFGFGGGGMVVDRRVCYESVRAKVARWRYKTSVLGAPNPPERVMYAACVRRRSSDHPATRCQDGARSVQGLPHSPVRNLIGMEKDGGSSGRVASDPGVLGQTGVRSVR